MGPTVRMAPTEPMAPKAPMARTARTARTGMDGADGTDGQDGDTFGQDGLMQVGLSRLATVPAGAEVTGAYISPEGTLFFNEQHPDTENTTADDDGIVHNKGAVGYVAGVNINSIPRNAQSVPIPDSIAKAETTQVAYGEYKVLGQRDDTFGGALPNGLGGIMSADGSTKVVAADMPDFNGYVSTGAAEGYLFTNWEFYPGGMSRMKLTGDASTGIWSVDTSDVMMVDFGEWGTLANCFGTVTPWGTPMTSEEWGGPAGSYSGTAAWNDPTEAPAGREFLAAYLDPTAASGSVATKFPNPYRYEWLVEITEPTSAAPVAVKHFTMGRYGHENGVCMPDEVTCYMSEDQTHGAMYKFVADTAADMSAGTLYAAKFTQDEFNTDPALTGFDIEWIELANSDNATIEAFVAEYDAITAADFVSGESNYMTEADVDAWAAWVVGGRTAGATYPSVADGGSSTTAGQAMDDRAAFLESKHAAAALGATAELRKFEGINVNVLRAEEAVEGTDLIAGETVDTAYVYFAISDIDRGMLVGDTGLTVGRDDIRLNDRVRDCGGVYRMPLIAGYDVARMEPVIMGAPEDKTVSSADQCDPNAIAQPDNVLVMDDGRILIGEDGGQENNALWLFDPEA